jgi:hypothetical protein
VCKSKKKKTMMTKLHVIMALGFIAVERRRSQQEGVEVLVITTLGCVIGERRRSR